MIVVGATVTSGVFVKSLAGFLGGKLDKVLMRIVDIFLSIPELIFALAIAVVLEPSFANIILALAMVYWVKHARITRGQIIHLKQNEYANAGRITGDSRFRIFITDVLPNSITPVVVQATLVMGAIVLDSGTLSFIGLAKLGRRSGGFW